MIAFRMTDAGNLELALLSASQRVRDALRRAVPRAGLTLLAYVKASKLSGQVLRTRSGRLRRSINQVTRETPTRFETQVGTNVAYAARHEYGFTGTETVRAHLRTIKQSFGRPITARAVAVASFTRHVHTPERSFLRSALRDLAPQLERDLRDAVVTAVEGRA